jgi:hypothetical protein
MRSIAGIMCIGRLKDLNIGKLGIELRFKNYDLRGHFELQTNLPKVKLMDFRFEVLEDVVNQKS